MQAWDISAGVWMQGSCNAVKGGPPGPLTSRQHLQQTTLLLARLHSHRSPILCPSSRLVPPLERSAIACSSLLEDKLTSCREAALCTWACGSKTPACGLGRLAIALAEFVCLVSTQALSTYKCDGGNGVHRMPCLCLHRILLTSDRSGAAILAGLSRAIAFLPCTISSGRPQSCLVKGSSTRRLLNLFSCDSAS